MKLSETVNQYVTHKQSMGMRFCTEKRTLKSFCRAMGDIAIAEVEADRVLAYIAGTGPVSWLLPFCHHASLCHNLPTPQGSAQTTSDLRSIYLLARGATSLARSNRFV